MRLKVPSWPPPAASSTRHLNTDGGDPPAWTVSLTGRPYKATVRRMALDAMSIETNGAIGNGAASFTGSYTLNIRASNVSAHSATLTITAFNITQMSSLLHIPGNSRAEMYENAFACVEYRLCPTFQVTKWTEHVEWR